MTSFLRLHLGTTALLLGFAVVARPVVTGDALEYWLTTESLCNHLSPDLRPRDVRSLARLDERLGADINFGPLRQAYFPDRGGAWYSMHFWGYSALVLPARLVLRALGLNGLRAPQVTNALFLAFALHQVLFASTLAPRRRLLLFFLVLLSPALPFLRWAHPEIVTFSAVTAALVRLQAGHRSSPVLLSAVGAMQNPPLVFLTAACWVHAIRGPATRDASPGRRPGLWRPSLLALPAVLPPVFYCWRFGTPSLLARESTGLDLLSVHKSLELFLDLNLGLLPYVPVTLLMAALVLVLLPFRGRQGIGPLVLAGVVFLMALSTTVTVNWNHGTSGPSRYAIWLLPFVLLAAVTLEARLPAAVPRARRAAAGMGIAALAVQALIVIARGGPLAEADYLQHSYAARLALRYVPRLYNPSHAIFMARTAHDAYAIEGPFIYEDGGRCRKALVQRRHRSELRSRCGAIPAADEAALSAPSARNDWRYVDY